ncbi:MAG: sulfatase [Planctomycetota bacterium]|nr:sulfatase [Planctomycetota bacterium]
MTAIAIAALGLLSFVSAPAQEPPPARPNIVVLVVDDLGWADLACYGSSFHDTPHADALAAGGLRFTDAYAAAPVCSPTRAALMTGRHPARLATTDYFGAAQPKSWKRNTKLLPASYEDRLALDELTLAEALGRTGYATFFAGKWHLGPEAFWPEHQGFDVNKGGITRGGPYGGDKYFSPYGNPRLEDGPDGEHLPARLAREAVDFMAGERDDPFLVYLSFYSVHTPLMAPDELTAKYRARKAERGLEATWGSEHERKVREVQEHAVYAGMVEAVDAAIGTVLDGLDELGLAEDTLVVLTSDNGGLSTSEGHPTSNLPLRAGKGWIYEGGLRVPMIVRWPGRIAPGTTTAVPVQSMDLMPTLLEVAGVQVAGTAQAADAAAEGSPASAGAGASLGARPLDGASLAPLLAGGAGPARDALFWHYPHYGNQGGAPAGAIRAGRWKLVEWYEDGTLELFDLVADPGESQDLAAAEPERTAHLRAQLAAWREQVGARLPEPNPDFDPETREGR